MGLDPPANHDLPGQRRRALGPPPRHVEGDGIAPRLVPVDQRRRQPVRQQEIAPIGVAVDHRLRTRDAGQRPQAQPAYIARQRRQVRVPAAAPLAKIGGRNEPRPLRQLPRRRVKPPQRRFRRCRIPTRNARDKGLQRPAVRHQPAPVRPHEMWHPEPGRRRRGQHRPQPSHLCLAPTRRFRHERPTVDLDQQHEVPRAARQGPKDPPRPPGRGRRLSPQAAPAPAPPSSPRPRGRSADAPVPRRPPP